MVMSARPSYSATSPMLCTAASPAQNRGGKTGFSRACCTSTSRICLRLLRREIAQEVQVVALPPRCGQTPPSPPCSAQCMSGGGGASCSSSAPDGFPPVPSHSARTPRASSPSAQSPPAQPGRAPPAGYTGTARPRANVVDRRAMLHFARPPRVGNEVRIFIVQLP